MNFKDSQKGKTWFPLDIECNETEFLKRDTEFYKIMLQQKLTSKNDYTKFTFTVHIGSSK